MLLRDPACAVATALPAQLRDFPEWHRGRARYALWMLAVEDAALLTHIRRLQAALADLLHPTGARQPHLTLFVCGFPAEHAVHDDDFPGERLEAQCAALRAAPGTVCELPIGAPDAFASAAILPVADPQQRLARWRAQLAACSAEIRQQAYCPHITLGLFREAWPVELIRERLAALPQSAPHLPVQRLTHATYAANDLFGALQAERSIELTPG